MKHRSLLSAALALALVGAGGVAVGQPSHPGQRHGMHAGAPHAGAGMGPGMGMGLMGRGSATPAERRDIHSLLFEHEGIRRTVTLLPNGIRTVTESDDPQLAETIRRHVADMHVRIREGRDPGLPVESATLRSLFPVGDKIASTYELTEKGVRVVQTSSDPAVVTALQGHAGEVSDLVNRGIVAAHETMMQNRQSMSGRRQGRQGQQ